MTTIRTFRKISALLALGGALTATAFSAPASAASTTCVPTQVEAIGATGFPSFMVNCASVNYSVFVTAPSGCSTGDNRSIDAVKIWLSLAQASLLSGKSLQIYYDTCGGSNTVTDMILIK
jgi:hypothetical protein